MEQRAERHFFAGSNTSRGFYSYYSHIITHKEAEHIYILKGGPGTGKSSFIADIGKRFQSEGESIELIHCASDSDSLDAVLFPRLHIALIDGTAPHIIEPWFPGVIEEIVDLSEFCDVESIKKHKDNIFDLNEQTEKLLRRAYRYLGAAGCVMGDLTDMYGYSLGSTAAYAQAANIAQKEFSEFEYNSKSAGGRKQFASAITPSGVVHYADTLFDEDFKFYLIVSNWGVGVNVMLESIAAEAEARGLFTEKYYCPMEPAQRLEHLIIPSRKLAFISENRYLKVWRRPDAVIDMMGYSESRSGKDEIGFAEASMNTLLNEAIFALKEAKETRDESKKLYTKCIDFDGVNKKADKVYESIMKTSEEFKMV